jgi:hypothetical protein
MTQHAFPVAALHVVLCRAHIDSAKELVRLYGDKFDLLQPNSTAAQAKQRDTSSASQGTIKSLEEVKQLISNHLHVSVKAALLALFLLCVKADGGSC